MPPTVGVVLAGGLSRRMGGQDKVLLAFEGLTLLEYVAQRLAPQCESLIVNANGEPRRFGTLPFPVVTDSVAGHLGPLAGILTALEWTQAHRPGVEWVVSVPADTPFVPSDLVGRLHEARGESRHTLACASSGEQLHFAVGLWPISLRQDLREMLVKSDIRSIRDWAKRHGYAEASWHTEPRDPFFNINTPDDWVTAKVLLQQERRR
ncbi:molybdenum cofactor guanylyltransferase MobA [Microvirga terrae]|uniref:Molybdenum cofactor guanylyltransferase n=1 Tax=Microvirga terrae TaxID=2740529 RepID=A0ABY5RWZ3_9HYPH|nr:molybdenum cofactor guanylyltransferase MobA [Microvirga terrae]UVF20727.1 molybdenum cofactor guanylyltransferase MobA [Microvirga terrae]